MEIKIYPVKNEVLRPFIKHFYRLSCEAGQAGICYVAFPGIHHFVTMNTEARREQTENHFKFSYQPGSEATCDLVCNFGEPHIWQYTGKIYEWNTCFEPLGLNAFLDQPLKDYQKGPFTPFDIAPDSELLTSLFSMSTEEGQAQALEAFWLGRLKGFSHPWLYELLGVLLKEKENRLTLSAFAARHGIARSTLHDTFVSFIGTTPQRLEKVGRFRRAMDGYRSVAGETNLSNIAQLCSYFDQSHMIRDFRALTGYSPKDFFARITVLAGGINWQLV